VKINAKDTQKGRTKRISFSAEGSALDMQYVFVSLNIKETLYIELFTELATYDKSLSLEMYLPKGHFNAMCKMMHTLYEYGFNFEQIRGLFGNFIALNTVIKLVHYFGFEKNIKERKPHFQLYQKPITIKFTSPKKKNLTIDEILALTVRVFNTNTGICIESLMASPETMHLRKQKQPCNVQQIRNFKKLKKNYCYIPPCS